MDHNKGHNAPVELKQTEKFKLIGLRPNLVYQALNFRVSKQRLVLSVNPTIVSMFRKKLGERNYRDEDKEEVKQEG